MTGFEFAAPCLRTALVAIIALAGVDSAVAQTKPASYPELPSEIPETFEPVTSAWEYERREVMIPMRDGVRLHTVVLVPKGAERAPILLTRTPYGADDLTSHAESAHLGPVLQGYDNPTDVIVEGGYIRVVQDVRGKYGSEGDYVMNRPVRGPQNPTPVDHATDTYDTIEWLVNNVPESNDKVGIIGISYDGFLPLMALVDPHPALAAAVPMNPMVDGWIGDDWFHYGAFRQTMIPYFYDQEATRKSELTWWTTHFDQYEAYLEAGSAGEMARSRGVDRLGFWNKLVAHPAYDAFWQDQAVDRILGARPLRVPTMIVHGLWDQEDIYGALAVYRALEPKDVRNDMVYLVMGPWWHGQQIREGSTIGALRLGSDTSLWFRQNVLAPFLARHLEDDAAAAEVAPVTAFETGTNRWRRLDAWREECDGGCSKLYLRADETLAFRAPEESEDRDTDWVSDPAKPVPYLPRPIAADNRDWRAWLVSDQRHVTSRPDVVSFVSEVLAEPVKIAGRPVANLIASTSGTDSDWVVKVIDIYPPEVAAQPEMGGYQLMVSADVFRGRYRESLEEPAPLAAGEPLLYRFALPAANHVFLPGHRIMVQVQTSWFPLYDRNPQSFVESIFFAKPDDYVKATQRIWHAPDRASFIEMPVVK